MLVKWVVNDAKTESVKYNVMIKCNYQILIWNIKTKFVMNIPKFFVWPTLFCSTTTLDRPANKSVIKT